jgi:hypothetical protein
MEEEILPFVETVRVRRRLSVVRRPDDDAQPVSRLVRKSGAEGTGQPIQKTRPNSGSRRSARAAR